MTLPPLAEAEKTLQTAWSQNTSDKPENWHPHKPSIGQAAVTACLIYEYFGIDIISGKAILPNGEEIIHYWNFGIDITRNQFPIGTIIKPINQSRNPYNDLLSNPKFLQRFKILKENYQKIEKTTVSLIR